MGGISHFPSNFRGVTINRGLRWCFPSLSHLSFPLAPCPSLNNGHKLYTQPRDLPELLWDTLLLWEFRHLLSCLSNLIRQWDMLFCIFPGASVERQFLEGRNWNTVQGDGACLRSKIPWKSHASSPAASPSHRILPEILWENMPYFHLSEHTNVKAALLIIYTPVSPSVLEI